MNHRTFCNKNKIPYAIKTLIWFHFVHPTFKTYYLYIYNFSLDAKYKRVHQNLFSGNLSFINPLWIFTRFNAFKLLSSNGFSCLAFYISFSIDIYHKMHLYSTYTLQINLLFLGYTSSFYLNVMLCMSFILFCEGKRVVKTLSWLSCEVKIRNFFLNLFV